MPVPRDLVCDRSNVFLPPENSDLGGCRGQSIFCLFVCLKGLLSLHHFSGSYPPLNPSSCVDIPSGPTCPAFLSGNIPEAFDISCYFPQFSLPPPCWSEKAQAASPPHPNNRPHCRRPSSSPSLQSEPHFFLFLCLPMLTPVGIPCLWVQ